MWTGDMQSGYPTQWALNPSAYQNLSNDQVDWASLAQQWIKMKETFPAEQVPPAPPPPPIKLSELHEVEGGEAPMDMSKDDAGPPDGANWSSWDSWQQWGWNWSGSGPNPTGPVVPPASSNKVTAAPSGPPYSYTQSNSTPEAGNSFEYNHGSAIPDQFNQQSYWSEPAPFIRANKNSEWRNDRSSTRHKSVKSDEEEDSTAVIDAAKRKQLPAWIREGLEKMEREKQKKIERDRMLKEREDEMSRRRTEEQTSQQINSGIPPKSKFDTDSDESEKESEEVAIKPRRSRFHDSGSPARNQTILPKLSPSPPPQRPRTKEQIMQDVMLKVRKILTEILMVVTNEEMRTVVDETMASYRAKAPAMQLRKTPALSSLTGKLGLGIYDSDSEVSDPESDNEASTQENGLDSDQELKERIVKRKQEFARIEREIESRIKEQEERERKLLLQEYSEAHEEEETEVKDEPQVEPNHNGSGVKVELQEREPTNTESQSSMPAARLPNVDYHTPERLHRSFRESSGENTRSSSSDSSDSSHDSYSRSRSRSSSDSRYKKSRKSSRRRKDKKTSRSRRRRSLSRGSDRRKSSHKKDSRDERRDEKRRKDRSRSRDNRRYSEYSNSSSRRRRSPSYHQSPSRHSPSSSHYFSIVSYAASRKRRHHSRSSSPEVSRGKRSSHRSRD